ncbi:alpha/beta-hydrolase [Aaosphaeria arxii CBS 175.79]|uniref:Carboxylic ester hydrolase n=1 Tax=Aaosphaeria arxii CBS 175.79 TaxID=1450172 RepID=A0A6A5Y879_9PLEO|nr:alpha/beta-hydrolase [Aaosphaeria arxii CBS 175.79]KAF2021516.1 alpha/beta-hydrolase [Aaosphaeria arxii CBS 175.79]
MRLIATLAIGASLRLFAGASPVSSVPLGAPTAQLRNGTISGVGSRPLDQDFFLGIPYAQPPVDNLRFRNPESLNTSWSGVHTAARYSPACVGYGPSQMGYNVSEDCLYLNVIRPSGTCAQDKLPVVVWIHGGGWVQGSGVDLRYNMSFIVQQSQEMGQPVVAVTINYRLSAWGFLQGFKSDSRLRDNAGSNWGFRDQRLALHWIQENIQAFGGDPDRVTIWGQSAGAASVGMHLLAYNGRNDNLFRGAIMESGNPILVGAMNRTYEPLFQNLTEHAGCQDAPDRLQCLRDLPFLELNDIVNTTQFSGSWTPQIDEDIVARYSSDQVSQGAFVKVPIIVGANSDEGTGFAPKGLNTSKEFLNTLTTGSSAMNETIAQEILKAYPLESPDNDLTNLGPIDFVPPAYPYGLQYRRTTTYYTDQTFVANRRLTCRTWAALNLPSYCFRFNAIPSWATPYDGATHFVEVAFAMKNLDGVGYPPVRTPPFQGLSQSYKQLSTLMSGDWVSFVNHGDPNAWDRRRVLEGLQDVVPVWGTYSVDNERLFVYEGNVTNRMEDDVWRSEGIDLINSLNKVVYDR